MAADLPNTVMDYIVENLQGYFNEEFEGLTETQKKQQPLYLRSVLKGPLQDDPTLRAFYFTVMPDTTLAKDNMHWRVPINSQRRGMLGIHQEHPIHEVGGRYLYMTFFLIEGWLPLQTSREKVHEVAGAGLRRLERAFARIAKDIFFQGLVTDDGMESTNAGFPQVFNNDGAHYSLQGGENEWYAQLTLRFHVYSAIERDYFETVEP